MKLRFATSKDLEDLVSLNSEEVWGDPVQWETLSQEERWADGMWSCDPDLLAWYLNVLQQTGGGIIVAEHEDKIIAQLDYCLSLDNIVDFEGERAHIIWVLVSQQYRRQGIAMQLIDFLKQQIMVPIWVEPEDHRSEALYESLGSKTYSISNWTLSISGITDIILDNRIEGQSITYDDLHARLSDSSLLVGRYYAPAYDLFQLQYSQPVKEYMWGETSGPVLQTFHRGQTEVYAILTQYPRLWVKPGYTTAGLREILAGICLQLFEEGFDMIFVQLYNESGINGILEDLGFTCTIEDDAVFVLNQ